MNFKTILITGGAGYVGSLLTPRLLDEGYNVRVLDLFIYGDVFKPIESRPGLMQIKGDIRDQKLLKKSFEGVDAVIHLACISNDPSFELNPDLARTINYDAFEPLVAIAKKRKVRRFIYASSASVYGVSDMPDITEEHALLPVTDYNKYKALCEPILARYQSPDFTTVTIRPSTLCGYAPRQRFDLTVNILTCNAVNKGEITVFGGEQERPNLHIEDMVDLYVQLLREPDARLAGEIFNAGWENFKVSEIALMVKSVVERIVPGRSNLPIKTTTSDDIRSYRVSSGKIKRVLGFEPRRTIEDAVRDLCTAFAEGRYQDPLNNELYYNIRRMRNIHLA